MFDVGPPEFYLARAVAELLGCYHAGRYVERVIPPDASLSRNTQDVPIWNAARVRLWRSGDRWPASAKQPEYFSLRGASFRAGITYSVAKRVMPEFADAILLYGVDEKQPLFTDGTCYRVRKLVKAGAIKIRRDGLVKAKFGVHFAAPTHRLAEIASENDFRRRHRPLIY